MVVDDEADILTIVGKGLENNGYSAVGYADPIKADGHNDEIPGMVNEGFKRSMLANSDFHKAVADALDGTGDTPLSSYHVIMSKVYRSFLAG